MAHPVFSKLIFMQCVTIFSTGVTCKLCYSNSNVINIAPLDSCLNNIRFITTNSRLKLHIKCPPKQAVSLII